MAIENNITRLVLPQIASLQPYQTGRSAESLLQEYGFTVAEIVHLASNENPLGPSPRVYEQMAQQGALGCYPDGNAAALRNALATHLAVEPEQLVFGNGSNEVLELIARTFVSPQHEVAYTQYGFAVYPLITQVIGARHRVVPARDLACDLDAMAAQLTTRTKLVFLANPNNPTATWFDATTFSDFLQQIPAETIVVLDEAYHEYVAASEDAKSMPQAIPLLQEHPNLIITRTFSKAWGLAGLRIGYAIAHPELADCINRIRQPFNNNMLALAAALCALQDKEHLQRSLLLNEQAKQQLSAGLAALDLHYICSPANFLLLRLPSRWTGADLAKELLQHGIIVRPLDNYALPQHIRISTATETGNDRFLQVLKSLL